MSELGRIIGQQVADWVAVNQKAIQRRAFLVGRLVIWAGRYKSDRVYAFNDMVMFRSYIALAMEDSPQGLPQPGGAGWTIVANLATAGVDNFPDVAAESALALNTPVEVVTSAISRWAIKQIQDAVVGVPGLVRWRGWWSSGEVYQDRDLVLYNRSVWLNAGGDGPPNRNGWQWLLSTQSGNVSEVGIPAPVLAFHALVPDDDGVMVGVKTGIGPLTADHAASIYAKDEATGYYHEFGANKVVWAGGRFIDEDTVSAEDPGGTPYAEAPWLQYNPLATNAGTYSRNLTTGWSNGNCLITYDQVGMTGEANTASKVLDNSASAVFCFYRPSNVVAAANKIVTEYRLKKRTPAGSNLMLQVHLSGGTVQNIAISFNPETGAYLNWIGSADVVEVNDRGTYFQVLIELTNNGTNTSAGRGIGPSYFTVDTITQDEAATGEIIVYNTAVFDDRTIPEVRSLPPIFTDGAAVSIDETVYSVPGSNHSQTNRGYSFYWTPTYDTAEVTDKRELLSLADGANLSYYDAANGEVESTDGTNTIGAVQSVVPGTTYQISIAIGQAGDNRLALAVDDGPWQEGPYDGAFEVGTLLQLFRNHGYVGYMHDLQGWSGDYDAVKQRLDVLRGA